MRKKYPRADPATTTKKTISPRVGGTKTAVFIGGGPIPEDEEGLLLLPVAAVAVVAVAAAPAKAFVVESAAQLFGNYRCSA